jgi:hypothetical protein
MMVGPTLWALSTVIHPITVPKELAMLSSRQITEILLASREGFTVDRDGNTPISGYMVGGLVPSLILEPGQPLREDIETWIETQRKVIALPAPWFGIWEDSETGKIYVDLSQQYEDLYTALAVADSRKELAIWDVASAQEVRTEYAPDIEPVVSSALQYLF